MPSTTVAAIVPVYNRPRIVLDALDSIAAQARKPDRLIVVDDGSQDATADAVRMWIARHPELSGELLCQGNAGVSVARNTGAHACGCDLLAFLDSDDVWPDDYLASVADVMEREPAAVAVTTNRVQVDEPKGTSRRINFDHLAGDVVEKLFFGRPPGQPNTAYRASAFERVGGFDPALRCAEDYHLQLMLSLQGPWAHAEGQPVTTRKTQADHDQENDQQQHLSKQFGDRRYRTAAMLDRFVNEQGGGERLPGKATDARLSKAWFAAGRQLYRAGEGRRAVDCFARARRYRPWHPRLWWAAGLVRLSRQTTPGR